MSYVFHRLNGVLRITPQPAWVGGVGSAGALQLALEALRLVERGQDQEVATAVLEGHDVALGPVPPVGTS